MKESSRELVERQHRETIDSLRAQPPWPPSEQPEQPFPELPEAEPGSPVAEEWEMFRREVGRLLSQGCKGRFALVKGGHTITVWDTLHDAAQAGQLLHGQEPCLIQEILPYLRPLRAGFNRPCHD